MIFHDIQQNSPEWDALRLGKFTASTFKDLFMKETTQGHQDAIHKVVYERLTGESPESYQSDYMKRGHEIEPLAREYYELTTFSKVHNGGFFELDEWVGASPDGLVDDDGQLEIKCPKYTTLINYLLENKLPNIYDWQVQGQLYVTGRQWCDFVAYHPKLKPLILRVERDEAKIKLLQEKLTESITRVQQIMERIK